GASGVLINICGGGDLTLGEATTINDIIHDAVGDEAEIIFGAATDPSMQGEVRVTVIATGFDRVETPATAPVLPAKPAPGVINFPSGKRTPAPPPVTQIPITPPAPARTEPRRTPAANDVPEMEIPTFIRRQMD
ncbi:MAG: cell division protein FtsZ, partial [Gemmatimonadota bacterium]